MSTKQDLLQMLRENPGAYISGQQIADRLGVSRNSIWKAINQLKAEGYPIEGRSKAGYCLAAGAQPLTQDAVAELVTVPCTVEVHDSVGSTNDLAKTAPLSHRPLAIIANRQTQGRGRLGRTFVSPGGTGLYLSIALMPMFSLERSQYVTMAAAVATARAIEKVCGVHVSIKWVNDLFYDGRKVCGILTEAQTNFETGQIDRLIIGIGINCFPGSFPPEIANIAGALSDSPGAFSRSTLAAEVVNETVRILEDLESRSFFDEYRDRCFILGRQIRVLDPYADAGAGRKAETAVPDAGDSTAPDAKPEPGWAAEALSIADDGGLVVRYLEGPKAGTTEALRTGEISIRI